MPVVCVIRQTRGGIRAARIPVRMAIMPPENPLQSIKSLTRVGKYDVVRKLGEGATSTVYLCRDSFANRDVAVKVVAQSAMSGVGEGKLMQRLFTTEASLAGKLDHPHIVQIWDAAADDDHAYIVMEYVEGGTLQRFTSADNLLGIGDVIEVIYKCARALDYASQQGVIHRDIKPANIMLKENNDVKIADFGSAAIAKADATLIDGIGTPAYMSPEQHMSKPLNHQTDIYALGIVMFQLLTGRAPFKADNIAGLAYQVLNSNPPLPSEFRQDVPLELDMIVIRALQRDTSKRYLTWSQFIDELAGMMGGDTALPKKGVFETGRFNSLRKLSFFDDFADADLWEVLRFSEWMTVAKDQVILKEGEAGDFFCILVSGEARVTRKRRLIANLKPGECLGEMACLGSPGKLRTADVVALQQVRMIKIPVSAYKKATDSCRIRFEHAFLRVLVERLIHANARLAMV
jgi:serine/threonine protein kinase